MENMIEAKKSGDMYMVPFYISREDLNHYGVETNDLEEFADFCARNIGNFMHECEFLNRMAFEFNKEKVDE